jgi:1,4-dihydroxy-2-naphthoate octaprenyltransferase
LGKKITRFQFVNSIAISYLILFIIYFKYDFTYWIFLPLISLPIAVILIKRLQTFEGERLNNTLELSAKYAALFGLLFSLGLIL